MGGDFGKYILREAYFQDPLLRAAVPYMPDLTLYNFRGTRFYVVQTSRSTDFEALRVQNAMSGTFHFSKKVYLFFFFSLSLSLCNNYLLLQQQFRWLRLKYPLRLLGRGKRGPVGILPNSNNYFLRSHQSSILWDLLLKQGKVSKFESIMP